MIRVPIIIDRPSGFPAGRKREPFSIQDDKLIVEYLASENPSGEHRKGNELWKRLEQNVGNKWPRGPAHTAQSWRNRYVNDADKFDARVAAYIKENRPKRKAALWLDAGDAKRRKLHNEQLEQGGGGGGGVTTKVEPELRPMSTLVDPSAGEAVANGHSSTVSRTKTTPIAESQVAADRPRMTPLPSASAAGSSAVQDLPPLRSLAATVAKRPAPVVFHGARKTVSQVPAQTTTSESSSSSRAASSSSLAGTSASRSGTSGKDSDSRQSANISSEHSRTHTASSASKSNRSRPLSASIHSQGSASSLHETMPGAFDARTSSSHHSQPLYPKLSPPADFASRASHLDAHENAHDGAVSHEPGADRRKPAVDPTRLPPTSSATAVQSSSTGEPRRPQPTVGLARVNGFHAARRSAQVYDDDTEEDLPPAPAARKTTTRVLITKDPFSNRRIHASSGVGPVSSSSSGARGRRDMLKPAVELSDHKDDDDDDMDYPVGPSANKGKGRATDYPVTTGAQHEAVDNVPDHEAAPMKSHAVAESSPESSPAPQSSPIERLLARSSSTVAVQQLSERDAPKRLPPIRTQPSFSKPRDAPSPFTSPKSSAPNGAIFVRRSEARELMQPVSKSSPPRKPAYSLNAIPPVPGKRRRGGGATSAEDDTPTTNGRLLKQQAREFVVPSLPASVSMPLPQAAKKDKAHRRRQTFSGYDVDLPDAGALLRSRERARRRSESLRPGSGSPHPHPHPGDERERALRRMSANHGFAPAIVRGVLAGAREDVRAADAVLARMRREAEREAVRALGDIVGDEFEVETSSVDAARVPEVDFSSGPRHRRSTGRWVESVALEDDKEEDWEPELPAEEEDAQMQDDGPLDPAQAPWTPEEDALILSGSPLKALKAIDDRRGVGAVASRLAALL